MEVFQEHEVVTLRIKLHQLISKAWIEGSVLQGWKDDPEKFTAMIKSLHTVMMASVCDSGLVSETFSVTKGVKQGKMLAPTLFYISL